MLVGGMLVPAIHDQWLMVSALSLVGSLAGFYFINDAEGTVTAENTNTLFGLNAVSALVAAYFIAMPKDSDDADEYYYYYYGYYDYYGYDYYYYSDYYCY
jgi:hypothetical protein